MPDAPSSRSAIARGLDRVRRWQHPRGQWQHPNDAGPLFLGAKLAFERALGSLRPDDAIAGERMLRAVQRNDGSTEAWPFAGHGSLEATSFWCAGMRAIGVDDDDPAVVRARAFVRAHGGLEANRVVVRALLVAAGLLPADTLPDLGLGYTAIPGHAAVLARVLGVNALLPAHTLPALIVGLRARGRPLSPRRARQLGRVVAYLDARQDRSGSWAGVPYYTLQAALVLHLAGVPSSDARIQRALSFSRSVDATTPRGLFVGAFFSTYWDTAHMLRLVAHRGLADPTVHAACEFLLEGQATGSSPSDWQTPPRGAPRDGGWAWQTGNTRNPDLDTTAHVLAALAEVVRADPTAAHRLGPAIARGRAWLCALQNRDGGWAAFSWGKRSAPPGPLYLRVPERVGRGLRARISAVWRSLDRRLAEVGDPATADVTGRVLMALGTLGHRCDEPPIASAIAFLARHQRDDGAWWSRWAINYLAATSYIALGLLAVGMPTDAPLLARALDWLVRQHNADGGFGETPASYEDPAQAGRGASTVQHTGLVTWALALAGRERDVPVVMAGLAYLRAAQLADGSWADHACFGTVFPHLHYYYNDGFPTYFALEGLRAGDPIA